MSSSAVLKRSAARDGGSYNAEFEDWMFGALPRRSLAKAGWAFDVSSE